MEKERLAFLEDKKCKHLKRTKIVEMLKTERNNLKDQLNSYEQGPFAKKTTEVFHLRKFISSLCVTKILFWFQNEQKLKNLLQLKENVQKQFEEQKVNLWELEGHIKKVKLFKLLRNDGRSLTFLVGERTAKIAGKSVDWKEV